jgi:hypothetical protein
VHGGEVLAAMPSCIVSMPGSDELEQSRNRGNTEKGAVLMKYYLKLQETISNLADIKFDLVQTHTQKIIVWD